MSEKTETTEPKNYGGMGGIKEGRRLNEGDAFEMAVERALGERLRGDNALCADLWGSLANVDWHHRDGHTASYSFRAAGDLVAAVKGAGNYMDWYCSASIGFARRVIAEAMAPEGWEPATDE